MADWQVTATTVHCADVDDEVTLLIYRDGTSTCTGHQKYSRPDKATAAILKRKGRSSGQTPACSGDECHLILEHRNKWQGD